MTDTNTTTYTIDQLASLTGLSPEDIFALTVDFAQCAWMQPSEGQYSQYMLDVLKAQAQS